MRMRPTAEDGGMATKKSEKRQRNKTVHIRLTDAEHAALLAAADNVGLTLGAYMRATALGSPGPRAARKPPVVREELVRILSQLGKIGSNVNQIARAVNSGDDPNGLSDDIKAAVVALAEIHAAAAHALGWKPGMDA